MPAGLLGRQGLGRGAELPALEAREFEVDLLQLGVRPRDLAGLGLHLLLQPRDQRGRIGRQTGRQLRHVDVGCSGVAEHARHIAPVSSSCASADAMSTAPACNGEAAQVRVMMLRSPRRCHGRPTVRASNCATVSCNAAAIAASPDE